MGDYVKELRKKIGHEPIVFPHAVTVVIDSSNRVLFEERKDDGYIDFPGGAVDLGEEVIDAAKRELLEETGLVADELKLFNIYSGEITKYVYFNGDVIYGVDTVYLVRKYHGELKPQKEEVSRLFFSSLEEVNGKLSPRNRKIIEELKEKL